MIMDRKKFLSVLLATPILSFVKPKEQPVSIEEVKKDLTIDVLGKINGNQLVLSNSRLMLLNPNEKRELLGYD